MASVFNSSNQPIAMYTQFVTDTHCSYHHLTRRGNHKIFVGMAPGVGKTYRMLDEGQRLKCQGKDVVIGFLETHNREDTIEKAEGLEIVPCKSVNRCGLIFREMDTESILARQPQLVLVDDLEHTNFLGFCREQRYQDVEALLAAGIDVYSTVNVQHFEGLTDTVASIPGIVVKAQIPDRLLDEAHEIVVVDVTPQMLEERLRNGKVYPLASIERSLETVFQRQNLVVLRELTLRQVARTIEKTRIREADQLPHRVVINPSSICCVHEQVLVCVSTEAHAIQLLKRGAYLANTMNASLYGLFVQNPDCSLTKTELLYLKTCEQLCVDLNGTFLQVNGFDIPTTIAQIAKTHHITQVIVGKTCRSPWPITFHRSVIDRLVGLLAPQTDLHVISID